MRRLFWIGVGAAGTVVVARRLRTAWHRYTPEGVAEQVGAAGVGAVATARSAVDVFRSSFASRQRDLVDGLLISPDGGDPAAVFSRGGRTSGGPENGWGPPARPSGRVDDDEPLYDF